MMHGHKSLKSVTSVYQAHSVVFSRTGKEHSQRNIVQVVEIRLAKERLCKIQHSHDGGYKEYYLLRCEAKLFGRQVPSFRRNLPP